jgi:hypothetical protein
VTYVRGIGKLKTIL